MKAYTDIEQSKKLAEILPLESADMARCGSENVIMVNYISAKKEFSVCGEITITPCWSLAALLGVLPLVDFKTPQLIGTPKTLYRCMYNYVLKSHAYDNPVDACYEMIIHLNKLNLL